LIQRCRRQQGITAGVPGRSYTKRKRRPAVSAPSSSLQTNASSAEYILTELSSTNSLRHSGVVSSREHRLGLFWRAQQRRRRYYQLDRRHAFQNRSADADTSICGRSGRIADLSALTTTESESQSTSSVFRYKARNRRAKIGNELGVSAVLTGRLCSAARIDDQRRTG